MKGYAISALCLSLFAMHCYADIPAALTEGTANYQEILHWSKEKIRLEAKSDFTDSEIESRLSGFPVLLNQQCDSLKLLFIENTPQCGAINCKYFVFSITTPSSKQPNYRYINEITFSANRLFCYEKNAKPNNYLVTSEHETNATDLLNLYQVTKNKLTHKAQIEIDHTKTQENKFYESLWKNHVEESDLLKGFKQH